MDFILMTPLLKSPRKNVTLIEKLKEFNAYNNDTEIVHKAGGPYNGFLIKKYSPERQSSLGKSHLSFKLNVYVRDSTSGEFQQEYRTIHFWFLAQSSNEEQRIGYCNEFFKFIFKNSFPKDYYSFLLLQMQLLKGFKPIDKLLVEIEKIGLPMTQDAYDKLNNVKESRLILSEKILELLEKAFPDPISVDELANLTQSDEQYVYDLLKELLERNLVKYYDNGNLWIRNIVNTQDEQTHEVILIHQNPTLINDDQPTIAIITVNYYEKLAIDAMMINKVTYVRHKPEGESNVYTIGNIGVHRVVSTKLPSLNRDSRSSKIISGNSTTRLLGIFQRVEHVLLVGCGGGVPRYTDALNHPRRGDIVVSYPQSDDKNFVYGHFETQKNQKNHEVIWKTWKPGNLDLYRIVGDIKKSYNPQLNKAYPWEEYLNEGILALSNEELNCTRPNEDKLFFHVGESNVIEINHPEDGLIRRKNAPLVRFGGVGGGEKVIKNDVIRQKLSAQFGIIAFDSDLDQVMDAIDGNRTDSFIIIRAIADYTDGTTCKEWQPYASLCAAAFTKAILCALPAAPKSPN